MMIESVAVVPVNILAAVCAGVMLSVSLAAGYAIWILSEMCVGDPAASEVRCCECCVGSLGFADFADLQGCVDLWGCVGCVDSVGFLDCVDVKCGCRGYDVDDAADAESHHGDELVVVEAAADALLSTPAAVGPGTAIVGKRENETAEISFVASAARIGRQTCASLAVQLLQACGAL
mmetsp:Transcript_69294/g.122653  ORF Transcript_69294/g.122653 Transcript_69294/m.122653 type:complete len:177 (+) Transcript_69294:284-814(+)